MPATLASWTWGLCILNNTADNLQLAALSCRSAPYQDSLRNPSLGQRYREDEGTPRAGRAPLLCIFAEPLHSMPLAATYEEANQAGNLGLWAAKLLDKERAVPPDTSLNYSRTRATLTGS